jgi:hypothetical protein
MVQGLHHDQLPLEGVVGLVEQRAGHGHLGLCEHGIPARFLGREPKLPRATKQQLFVT